MVTEAKVCTGGWPELFRCFMNNIQRSLGRTRRRNRAFRMDRELAGLSPHLKRDLGLGPDGGPLDRRPGMWD